MAFPSGKSERIAVVIFWIWTFLRWTSYFFRGRQSERKKLKECRGNQRGRNESPAVLRAAPMSSIQGCQMCNYKRYLATLRFFEFSPRRVVKHIWLKEGGNSSVAGSPAEFGKRKRVSHTVLSSPANFIEIAIWVTYIPSKVHPPLSPALFASFTYSRWSFSSCGEFKCRKYVRKFVSPHRRYCPSAERKKKLRH